MKKITSFIEIFCTKTIFLLSMIMFGVFSYWAAKYVHEFPADYSEERVIGSLDSPIRNLMVFIFLFMLMFLVQKALLRGTNKSQKKRINIFVAVNMILVGVFGIIWVAGSHIMPYADQHQVYLTSVEFSQGIYRDMKEYFYMCPQQYGLAFLYECVLWIWESYHLIQYINVIFLVMIYFFGFKLSELLFDSSRAGLFTVLAMDCFLPLILYVNFVYGEMGTVAMSMCAVWFVMKWLEENKKRYVVAAVIAMTLAMLVRMNMVIVSVALTIILCVTALKKKSWKACVISLLLFVVPFGSIRAVELSYEARSGIKVGEGIPTVLVVAMGMQQSWQGAGAYNAYNHMVFWGGASGDSAVAAQIATDYIKDRVQEMMSDPATTRYFYQSKIWEQWNVGSMGSLFMTDHFEAAPFALAQSVYGGELQQVVLDWMNSYLFVIYAATFFYAAYGLIFVKDIRKSIFCLIAIGGLIFSLLWEAKSRYVFPYVVMILPCVGASWEMFSIYMNGLIAKIVKK